MGLFFKKKVLYPLLRAWGKQYAVGAQTGIGRISGGNGDRWIRSYEKNLEKYFKICEYV